MGNNPAVGKHRCNMCYKRCSTQDDYILQYSIDGKHIRFMRNRLESWK